MDKRLLRKLRVASFVPLVALGCGAGTAEEASLPLVEELTVPEGPTAESTNDPSPPAIEPASAPNLFRLAQDSIHSFNADLRSLFAKLHDMVTNHRPASVAGGVHRWLITSDGVVFRLVIERVRLGEITYDPEDDVPGEPAVAEGLPALDARLVAMRFRLEVRRVDENDGLFRLAAKGHVVRLVGAPLGTGAAVIYRDRIVEVLPSIVARHERIALRFDHRFRLHREAVRMAVADSNGGSVRAAWVYRQLSDRAGVLKLVRWGDIPQLPVSGNLPELFTLIAQWLRTDLGPVARAHAHIALGDLGPDTIDVIECANGIDHLGFRLVKLSDGTTYQVGSAGDPAACRPFARDIVPPGSGDETLPPDSTSP